MKVEEKGIGCDERHSAIKPNNRLRARNRTKIQKGNGRELAVQSKNKRKNF